MPKNSLLQVILMDEKINKGMMIMEVMQKFPKTAKVLMEKGIHCIGCIASSGETLEQGLKAHGMSGKDVDNAVKEMNDIIK